MKKLLCILISVIMLIPAVVSARVGDIAGQYYYTDITTILNDRVIDSINIGGETLISAEDMQQHGFFVYWLPDERKLDIFRATNAVIEPSLDLSNPYPDMPIGTVRGNYYETDIVTLLDDEQTISYNIGGRTYIHAEQMQEFGYIVEWKPIERRLVITSPHIAGYVYGIHMTHGGEKTTEGIGSFSVTYTDGKITAKGDADYFNSDLVLTPKGEYTFTMGFYQYQGLFYSTLLQDKLRPLACDGFGVDVPCDPAEKYDEINKIVKFSINGQEAKKIYMHRGVGNGHHDYTFIATDLPRYKQSEIKEIKISVGEPTGDEYEIVIPDYDYFKGL